MTPPPQPLPLCGTGSHKGYLKNQYVYCQSEKTVTPEISYPCCLIVTEGKSQSGVRKQQTVTMIMH